jgi:exodeoxyribonuclease VII large subunit
LARRRERLERAMRVVAERHRGVWLRLDTGLRGAAPARRVAAGRDRLGAAQRALVRAVRGGVDANRARLERHVAALDSLSPLAVLGRGYGLVRRARDGAIVREAGEAPSGELLDVRVARADLRVRVESSRERG